MEGQKITMVDGSLNVPNNPILPFIQGDGTGGDIWRASQRIFDAAVEKAYGGERKVVWKEVFAGENSFNKSGEWLPQETVYFNDALSHSKTKIILNETSKMFAWEVQCLGLPAQKELFNSGSCLQHFEVWQKQQPLLLESNRFIGSDSQLSSPWGMNKQTSVGTFALTDRETRIDRSQVLGLLKNFPDAVSACTHVNGLFVIRALAMYAEPIKDLFIKLWEVLRTIILDLSPCPPRIWQT